MKTKNKPLCKCGKPCAYYGIKGGYSKGCPECNAKNAERQRLGRAKNKTAAKPAAVTLGQLVGMATEAGVRVTVSLEPQAAKLVRVPDRKYPGTPYNRTLMATDANDAEIKKAFQSDPTSVWVITPTRVVERGPFMAASKAKPDENKKKE